MKQSKGLRAIIGAASVAIAAFGVHLGWRRIVPGRPAPSAYIDARQCQPCHAAIYRDYQQVAMSRSFAAAARATPIEDYERNNRFVHAASGRHYHMFRRDGRYFQRRYE